MPAFSDLLRRYRLAAGLTQEALADQAKISVRTLGEMERGGAHRPRKETLRLLCEALNLSPAERTAFLAMAPTHAPLSTSADVQGRLRHTLPQPLTPLVGRAAEIASVSALLHRSDTRILTLVGPPGVGKTRVAVELALRQMELFPGAVGFISLASVRDPDRLVQTVAQEFGLRESGRQPLREALHDYLRDIHLLLLDNFEHLMAAAPQIVDMLVTCPNLTVVVTSRMALHIRGEQEFVIAPLPTPQPCGLASLEALAQVPSVAIFLQRAQAVTPSFSLVPENAAPIANICRCLDGLPLAIELAASWIRLFSPRTLEARLDRRLALLIDGPTDLPERQQTLRHTFDWSYELLHPNEQALLRRLSVFVGGCTLEAAEAVCQSPDLPETSIAQGIQLLLRHHLLFTVEQGSGEQRIDMLETIREYGRDLLEGNCEMLAAGQAHASYFLRFAQTAERNLTGPTQVVWFDRLEQEHDNLRSALQWALDHSEPEIGMRLATSVWRFWLIRGHLSEGRRWLEALLGQSIGRSSVEPLLRAAALHAAGVLASRQGDFRAAQTLHEEGLTLQRTIGDSAGIARAANSLGVVYAQVGEFALAKVMLVESLALKVKLGDLHGAATTLNNLGHLALTAGDLSAAAPLYEESLRHWRMLGDTHGTSVTLANLGEVESRQERYDQATMLLKESLRLSQGLDDKEGVAQARYLLGSVAYGRGNAPAALEFYRESLELCWQIGSQDNTVLCLEGIAAIHGLLGSYFVAIRLSAAASALRVALGFPRSPADRIALERTVATARATLGSEVFAETWSEGETISLDEAIDFALRLTAATADPGGMLLSISSSTLRAENR